MEDLSMNELIAKINSLNDEIETTFYVGVMTIKDGKEVIRKADGYDFNELIIRKAELESELTQRLIKSRI